MNILKLIRSIAFIAIAIVAFILADKIDDMPYGDYVTSSIYGGDAYTGIQNASADTGCNVYKGNQIMQRGFKYIFFLTGLGFLAVGATGFPIRQSGIHNAEASSEEKENEN